MEILQFLINYLVKSNALDSIMPILNLLKNNSFDLKRVLSQIKPENIMQLVEMFLKNNAKKGPPKNEEPFYQLKPISNLADKQIVYTLNKYFSVI